MEQQIAPCITKDTMYPGHTSDASGTVQSKTAGKSAAVEGGIGGDVPRVAVGAGVAAQRGESTVPFVLVPSAPVPARQAFPRRDALGMQNSRPVPGALGVCPHTNVDAVGSGAQRLLVSRVVNS